MGSNAIIGFLHKFNFSVKHVTVDMIHVSPDRVVVRSREKGKLTLRQKGSNITYDFNAGINVIAIDSD